MNPARYLPFAALLLVSSIATAALQITNVHHDLAVIDKEKGEKVAVKFTLAAAADVTLRIYDGRDLLIRTIKSTERLDTGEHKLVWDVTDDAHRPVPPGAYHYTLLAQTDSGATVEHDLTDLTGGEDLEVTEFKWNPDTKTIQYRLPRMARVNIRIGLEDNGPLLRTLIDWVPRAAGPQREHWDGMDQSAVLDLSRHPKMAIAIQAYALSDNTILVRPNAAKNELIQDLPWGESRREIKKRPAKRMYAHHQQPLETRGDFSIELTLPDGLPSNDDGIPIVSGTLPVRLDISEKDRARALARRFEPVFFLDGVFVFENETGFLPMTWNWDTSGVNPGIHYLTANLRGYEGNFGIVSRKVFVKASGGSE